MTALCIRPRCRRPSYCRGLCRSDYATAAGQVRNGVTTWAKLEEAGKALKARRRGAKPTKREWFA